MRLCVIACEVVARELYHAAAGADGVVDIRLLTRGLHGMEAAEMRDRLQREIDATDASRYDAIAPGYALCSNGAAGVAARAVPVAIPRAHDCITFLLGSRARYAHEAGAHPGTYYMWADWHERDRSGADPTDAGDARELGIDRSFAEYAALYGKENARYIIEQLRGGLRHYDRLLFLETGLGGESPAREAARGRAEREGWRFEVARADLTLLEKLVSRRWDDDFLVLQPGQAVRPCYDERILDRDTCHCA